MSQNHGENGVIPEVHSTKGYGAKGWYGTVWVGEKPVFSAAGYDQEAELDARLERFVKAYHKARLSTCGEHPAVTPADLERLAPTLKVVR